MSIFNPDAFLANPISSASATKVVPIPVGNQPCFIKEVKPKVQGEWAILDVLLVFTSEEAKDATGQDEPSIRHGIFLDIDAAGQLDTGDGKNIGLGRLREAVGQNVDGEDWLPGMLVGMPVEAEIFHKIDGEDTYARVKRFHAVEA